MTAGKPTYNAAEEYRRGHRPMDPENKYPDGLYDVACPSAGVFKQVRGLKAADEQFVELAVEHHPATVTLSRNTADLIASAKRRKGSSDD